MVEGIERAQSCVPGSGRVAGRHLRLNGVALALIAILGSAVGSGIPSTALAQSSSSPQEISLPTGSLRASLDMLASDSGITVLYAPELVEGKSSPALSGRYTPGEALRLLLQGTGLQALEAGEATFVLKRVSATGESSPDPVGATGPVVPDAGRNISTIDGLVVTAQKREERLIDVPVSITAVSSEELARENLTGIADYFSKVPNLQYTGRASYNISLRGLSSGFASNPTVAIMIDDVQFGSSTMNGGRNNLADIDPSMLERIEVLRGPQGTLYGASSLGGLIKYVTRQPDTGYFFGRAEAGFSTVKGGGSGWSTRGSVNIPIAADRAAMTVSAFRRSDAPYIDNVHPANPGKNVNTADAHGGQAALLFKPHERVAITLNALMQRRDADYRPEIEVLPVAIPSVPNFIPRYGDYTINLMKTTEEHKRDQYSAKLEWDLGSMQLVSVSAWGDGSGSTLQDVSAPFAFVGGIYGYPQGAQVMINEASLAEKFSQEVRLSGETARLDWLLGLYYTSEDTALAQSMTLFDPSGSHVAKFYDNVSGLDYKERAVFVNGEYRLTDRWAVQAGVRYAENEQVSEAALIVDGTAQMIFGPTRTTLGRQFKDDVVTWAISPTYHFNQDLMGYLRISTGYRPGGFNSEALGGTRYDPDRVVNYELGVKGMVPDSGLGFDVALFHIDWKNIHLFNVDVGTNFSFFSNGGRAWSRGLEGSINWQGESGWSLAANLAVLDATLREDLPVVPGVDGIVGSAGDRLPGSSKLSGNVSAQKDFSLTGTVDAYWGASLGSLGNRQSEFITSGVANAQRFGIPGYSQVDLKAGLSHVSGWRFDVFVRNLLDKQGLITARNGGGTLANQAIFLQPRTLSITASRSF